MFVRLTSLIKISCVVLFVLQFANSTAFSQRGLKNIPDPDPELERKTFVVADGFEVTLFAADPRIAKPIQMNFDSQGRLWIASSEVYPHIKPGQKANDKVLVIEDTNGDGKADKTTVFADGLLIPTGVLPGDGGVYVANSTELLHFSDTNGDGKADQKRVVLSGFGTEDTHHILHTLRWGHDGMMYFNQSIYIHSHLETPRGVRRLDAGGIWHFRPESMELDVFMRGLVNPWGHHFDHWGQSFATDGAGGEGINYTFPGATFMTAQNARRILHGLNPGSPKHCGLEVLSGRHIPPEWRGNLITNDFRAHRVCRFVLSDNGSGYASKQQIELIKSTHVAFRPIDIKLGPDGAIYIADWYNPIIQHGEVDFRDPRRDHTHGRIWRITAKGRPLVKPPKIVGASVEQLLAAVKLPEEWTRLHAKLQLKQLGVKQVLPHLKSWIASLDKKGSDYEHHRLEALWIYQSLGIIEQQYLTELLGSPDYRVRAAATRVVYHWHTRLSDPLSLLASRVNDSHPRVRLEAVRALSRIHSPRAGSLAMQSLDHKMDRFLDFALWQTMRDLRQAWLPEVLAGKSVFGGNTSHLTFALKAIGSPAVVKPLMALLEQGKIPDDRSEDVLLLVAQLGGRAELAKILKLALNNKTTTSRRVAILDALVEVARRRKVTPEGDLKGVIRLLRAGDQAVQVAAIRACGVWQLQAARNDLVYLALRSENPSSGEVRRAAMTSLANLGGERSIAVLKNLVLSDSVSIRHAAVIALASVDTDLAADLAIQLMQQQGPDNRPADLFAAFLQRKNGPAILAKKLQGKTIFADIAKLGVRTIDTLGRQEPELIKALSTAGRLSQKRRGLTGDKMKVFLADVTAKGDAKRGEEIFRRSKQSCMKCHAIAGAGGQVGPDLVSLGASAQVDYLVDSLLEPNKKIKENYHSLVIETDEGDIISGIKLRETETTLLLRDVEDRPLSILKESIEQQRDGGSLMPAGLTDDLTRQELVDLVRFLSELGRVAAFSVGPEPVVRNWRVLSTTPEAKRRLNRTGLDTAASNDSAFTWGAAYATVSGSLPLSAIPTMQIHRNQDPVGFVRMRLEVTTAGMIGLNFGSTQGLTLWVDGRPTDIADQTKLRLENGVHTMTLAINKQTRKQNVRVELSDVPGSTAKAQIVSGK